jgi:hypothetical protein
MRVCGLPALISAPLLKLDLERLLPFCCPQAFPVNVPSALKFPG